MNRLRRIDIAVTTALLLVLSLVLCACTTATEATGVTEATAAPKVRVLIIPKFEADEISGDFPGEAQLFFERYLEGCEKVEVPNATPTTQFYMNEESGVGLLLTGSGKTAAGLSTMALLGWDAYDFSDTTIVSVGCAGGSTGHCVPGDVVVVTAACDNELGHRTDSTELTNPDPTAPTWFHDSSYDDYSCLQLNADLCDAVFELIRDTPLQTTETCKRVLRASYGDEAWCTRDPEVMKGTALTGDAYWKGTVNHEDADFIVRTYGCTDEYAVCEMEETAIMAAARCFGLDDCVISLRVVVNMDTFLKDETPEQLWIDATSYNEKVTPENSETFDAFELGMQNLYDTGSVVIDAVLAGEL